MGDTSPTAAWLTRRSRPSVGGGEAQRSSRGWSVTDEQPVRTAEVIGTLCLATDLGMGFPFEHGLQTTVIAMRLADALGVDRETRVETYYASLLSHAGCTTDVHVAVKLIGGSLTEHGHPVMYGSRREQAGGMLKAIPDPDVTGVTRAIQIIQRLPRLARTAPASIAANCEVAGMLADQTGAPDSVPGLLHYNTDRWDGKSPLRRATGDDIPLPMRIVAVAVDAAFQRHLGGVERAVRLTRERAGHAFDPEVAGCVVDNGEAILGLAAVRSSWDEVLALEPEPRRLLNGDEMDRALAAMGRFADLVSPYRSGHSRGVAGLAADAARRCGMDGDEVRLVRRAGLVHDLGCVAVHPGVWATADPLTPDEWEQLRLHPYHTERVLSQAPVLSGLVGVAGAHHERLDRSGYHRGSPAADLTMPARILATADCFHELREPRPGRDALSPEQAAEEVAAEANDGRLDPDAVTAVIEAAGQQAPPLDRPAGLSDREVEVVALLARGLMTKQVAKVLDISPKTADHHVQNAYRKIGVSSRAAATLFAMEHGLVRWGEFPIEGS